MQAPPVRSRIIPRDSFCLRTFVRHSSLVVYSRHLLTVASILFVGAGVMVSSLAAVRSQSPPPRKLAAHPSPPTPVAVELAGRLAAALAARASGEPARIASANLPLIAFCLREMGQLRLLEAA